MRRSERDGQDCWMKITADTNLLVRVATEDDAGQAAKARRLMLAADFVVVPSPCILEFVWVLQSVYRFPRDEVARAVLVLLGAANVIADAPTIQAGLRVYAAGGDFADGMIAAAGADMGGETFVSFDRRAVGQVAAIGLAALHAEEA